MYFLRVLSWYFGPPDLVLIHFVKICIIPTLKNFIVMKVIIIIILMEKQFLKPTNSDTFYRSYRNDPNFFRYS